MALGVLILLSWLAGIVVHWEFDEQGDMSEISSRSLPLVDWSVSSWSSSMPVAVGFVSLIGELGCGGDLELKRIISCLVARVALAAAIVG